MKNLLCFTTYPILVGLFLLSVSCSEKEGPPMYQETLYAATNSPLVVDAELITGKSGTRFPTLQDPNIQTLFNNRFLVFTTPTPPTQSGSQRFASDLVDDLVKVIGTVTIAIEPVPGTCVVPQANYDEIKITKGGSVSNFNVLANDKICRAIRGAAVRSFSDSRDANAVVFSVSTQGLAIRFTPPPNFVGTVTLVYQVGINPKTTMDPFVNPRENFEIVLTGLLKIVVS